MALAVAVSQPGREWTPAQWWEALVLRPTAGGAWARSLRSRKGERYAEGKLAGMLDKARAFVGSSGTIVCRADAMVAIARLRAAVEAVVWPGPGGGTDLKNLTARLQLGEQAGGLEHEVSVRQLAELMGCARSTVEASNSRLREARWLRLVDAGHRGTQLDLVPANPPDRASRPRVVCAPGTPSSLGGEGGRGCPGRRSEGSSGTVLCATASRNALATLKRWSGAEVVVIALRLQSACSWAR
ncbi:hypothetical protein ACFZAV_16750 [Streptomyces sp. NPDC008343]|uniref:hypothetical protein n=1 Tax=Streptomyces sp. NPDC008343 TaxID=3364828 RepID=UPI0036EA7FBC